MFVSEREIFACLKENCRLAADHCDLLAVIPARGLVYDALRGELAAAENCCRQIAWYREDTRWLKVGLQMEEAHKRSGGWLRTYPRTATSNEAHPLFTLLAEKLRDIRKNAERLETMATGRVGLILPDSYAA